ncbi:MAG: heavy-metal-associated domain-containing protein [Thermoplasmatales archaeon]
MKEKRVKLRIYGMTCDDCVATITESLKNNKGVIDVKISLIDKTGDVLIDEKTLKPEELLRCEVFTGLSPYRAILIDQ